MVEHAAARPGVNTDPLPLDLAVVAVTRRECRARQRRSHSIDLATRRCCGGGDPCWAIRVASLGRGMPRPIGSRAVGGVILFGSTFIGEGHSGGALLNERGGSSP